MVRRKISGPYVPIEQQTVLKERFSEKDRKDILAMRGYRLMNRGRRGEYWLIKATPLTLPQIDDMLARLVRLTTMDDLGNLVPMSLEETARRRKQAA